MRGFLDRLAARARGGAALASMPVVRPAAAPIQAPPAAEDDLADAVQAPLEPAAGPGSRDDLAEARPGHEDRLRPAAETIRAAPVPVAPAATVGEDGAPQAMPRRTAHEAAAAPRPGSGRPAPARPPRLDAGEVRPGDRPAGIGRPSASKRRGGTAVERAEPVARAAGRIGADPAPRETPAARTGLERLFETIEAADAVNPETRLADARPAGPAGATPALAADNAPPLVSIGRITISVAPPPPPQRAAPARTYGFHDYARLRRGLDR